MLNEASVTTLSGRQTEIQVEDIRTFGSTNSPAAVLATPAGTVETDQIPFGPALDILPTLSADALRFDLAITASLTEFLGYDDPAGFVPQQAGTPGMSSVVGTKGARPRQPIPHFRLERLPVTATVWDGETLVIGCGSRLPDKPEGQQRRLLLLVTPTVIDPAGNRTHADEDIEHARSSGGLLSVPR